jgi:peroxiredoxin
MRVKAGEPAPHFAVEDLYGRRVALHDFTGRMLLLAFYRAAVCPLCNLRTWHLVERYPEYRQRGLDIIVFVESSSEQTHKYFDRLRAPFPIVADVQRTVYQLYGLENSLPAALLPIVTRLGAYIQAWSMRIGGNPVQNVFDMDGRMSSLPGDFLIGPDLRIHTAYYGRDAGDFLLFSEIDYFLGRMTGGGAIEFGQRKSRWHVRR